MRQTLQNVMFGMLTASPVLNLLIIIGKCYIHLCNVKVRQITFNSYLPRVIEEFEVEKRVAIGCNIKISDLHERWKILNESAWGACLTDFLLFLFCAVCVCDGHVK